MQRLLSIGQGAMGENLSIGNAEGSLTGPASFKDIKFKNDQGLDLEVRSVAYDWQPGRLLSREVNVDRIDIDGITLRLPETQADEDEAEPSEPFQLSDIKLPVSLKADHVSLTDITVYPPGADEPIIIDKVLLRAGGEDDSVQLLELTVNAPQGNFTVDGNVMTSGDFPIEVMTAWDFEHPRFGSFTGEGAVTGDLQELSIKQEAQGFINANIDIDVTDALGKPAWDGEISVSSDDLGVLGEELAGIPFSFDLKTDGNLDQYQAIGKFTSDHPETGPVATDFNVTGNLKQVVISDSTITFEQAPTEIAYGGTVNLESLEADVTVDWTDLVYPIVADPKLVTSRNGSLSFSGGADDYKVELDTVVEQELAGELNVKLLATGSTEAVSIETFSVDGPPTSINVTGGVDLLSREIDIEGNWVDVRWPLVGDEELVRSSKADFSVTGTLDAYEVELNALVEQELTGELEVTLLADGSPKAVSIEQFSVEGDPTVLTVTGGVNLESLEVDIEGNWTDAQWPMVGDEQIVRSSQGGFSVKGSADDYKAELSALVEQEQAGELEVSLVAGGSTKAVSIEEFSVQGDPTSINVTGGVDLENQDVDIKGNWKDVRWPLVGDEVLVSSERAEFSIQGPLDDYQVNADIALAGKDIPEGDWKISTRGSTEKLTDLKITGNVLDGTVDASGDVVFSPTPEWDLLLSVDGINPGLHWPDYPGEVSMLTQTKGSITDNGPEMTAEIRDLSGNYRGQALAGGGSVQLKDGEFTADGMSVKVGDTSVDLDGAIGEELDLKFKMDGEQISNLVPGISGDIMLDAAVSGSPEAPKLDFNLAATNFDAGSVSTESLTGNGVIDLTGETDSEILITGESLEASGYKWQELKVEGKGRPEKHGLTVSMTSQAAPNLEIDLTGGVSGEQWSGSLNTLGVSKTPVGDWKLFEPVAIDAGKEAFSSSTLCLVNLPAVLCADGTWQSDAGVKARLAIERFSTALFEDAIPPDFSIDASLSGNADFSMAPGGKPNVRALFDIPGGTVQYTNNDTVFTATLGESDVQMNLEDNQVQTTANFALGEIGTMVAKILVTDLYGAQNLSGTVDSDIQDISLAGVASTKVTGLDGAFASDIQLSGTLTEPNVVGGLSLTDFGAEIPAVSLKLEGGNIKAQSDGNGNLVIDGAIESGDGDLTVNGTLNPATSAMELAIKGDDFRVANAKNTKAVISPDLRISIDGEEISVLGDLTIPSAFISAEGGGESGALLENEDVRIKGEQTDEIEEAAESSVRLGITVALGDDIKVSAGQFDGQLEGELTIEQVPGNVPTGSGVIEVTGGDYLVYGQKLTMERGRVLFGGGPVDNPSLDFKVFRDVPKYEIKAGVDVSGTAQVPILELESEPSQTDANTLSYILTGEPVGQGVSFTLGRFITPDLFVSYGLDLITRAQAFNLRYSVTDTLALIGTSVTAVDDGSGGVTSGDLVRTIER